MFKASDFAAYSFLNEDLPIAYVSEPSQCTSYLRLGNLCVRSTFIFHVVRFPYTAETYNNPQKLWAFVLVLAFRVYSTTC